MGFLTVQTVLLAYLGWTMSPMPTEVGHLGAAVYWWHTFDNDVYCVNPPLTRAVAGLPLVFNSPNYDWPADSFGPDDRPEWALGYSVLTANPVKTLRTGIVLARWSLIPFLLIGGYFGHRLSLEIYGREAGLVYLTLWCFTPLLLGWGATICPDAAAAALGMPAAYALRRWLRKPGWTRAVAAGACLGSLLIAKLTWIIALAAWPLVWAVWSVSSRPKRGAASNSPRASFAQLAALLGAALYVLNAVYFFEGTFCRAGEPVFISRLLTGRAPGEQPGTTPGGNRFRGTWAGEIPIPFPASFLRGLDIQRYDFERGKPSYLRGHWARHGWWDYYLYALAVKLPIGAWCLIGLTALLGALGRPRWSGWRDEMLLLAPGMAVFAFVSSQTGFSIHVRYVLPALPFLFVWTSRAGRVFATPRCRRGARAVRTLVVLAATVMACSSLCTFPHSLSYFNELAGGPMGGPKHLLGSNVDWGQDLFRLEDWCLRHPEASPLYVACWGGYPLRLTAINSSGRPPRLARSGRPGLRQPGDRLQIPRGWYALSINEIYDESRGYAHFRDLSPIATAGYSIRIYRIPADVAQP